MAKISLIHGDAGQHSVKADMIMTDPPYDMPGTELAGILDRYPAAHLVLITTMRQLVEFLAHSDWRLSFDFVLDAIVPKKSRSSRQPNYTHQTGVYLTRAGASSVFDRKRRQRSDVFEANGYWPTILRGARRTSEAAMAKDIEIWTDLLGSFDVESVVDPFAGTGTTGIAAFQLDLSATMIEIDPGCVASIRETFRFLDLKLHG